jgi:periplasmic protein TonB
MFSGLAVIEEHPVTRTALASFMLQSAIVVAALVFPMLYPHTLPDGLMRRRIFVPISSGEVRAEANTASTSSSTRTFHVPLIVTSGPSVHALVDPFARTSETLPPGMGVVGPQGDPNSVLNTLADAGPGPVLRPPTPSRVVRTSSMMEGSLIHRVQPRYPAIAKQLHIQGAVVVNAIIGRDGRIEQAQVIRGQALLDRAALDAVRQWQYRPYYLNGEAIEVETQITVNFVLER